MFLTISSKWLSKIGDTAFKSLRKGSHLPKVLSNSSNLVLIGGVNSS